MQVGILQKLIQELKLLHRCSESGPCIGSRMRDMEEGRLHFQLLREIPLALIEIIVDKHSIRAEIQKALNYGVIMDRFSLKFS